jgi:hypothetical protein
VGQVDASGQAQIEVSTVSVEVPAQFGDELVVVDEADLATADEPVVLGPLDGPRAGPGGDYDAVQLQWRLADPMTAGVRREQVNHLIGNVRGKGLSGSQDSHAHGPGRHERLEPPVRTARTVAVAGEVVAARLSPHLDPASGADDGSAGTEPAKRRDQHVVLVTQVRERDCLAASVSCQLQRRVDELGGGVQVQRSGHTAPVGVRGHRGEDSGELGG